MKTVIRYGLGVALAGALAIGSALAKSPDTAATGGAGASAGSSSTAAGTGSAGAKVSKSLQDKLERLHADNQAEIQLGQLASQNASSPDVKRFGERMQTDHQGLDQKLAAQAQTLGVSLEGKTFTKEQESAQKDMQKLQSMTGSDFDKAYMAHAVKDHKADLKNVKAAHGEAQSQHLTELAALLQKAETGMNGHLQLAQQVEKSVKSGGGGTASGAGSSSMGTGSANQGEQKTTAPPKSGTGTK